MKVLITACSFLLLLLSTSTSCKKDEASPSGLIGEWKEMELGDLNRTLTFRKDQTFQFSVNFKDGNVTIITGTYGTNGESLKVTAEEIQEHQSGQAPLKESTRLQLYENATFNISKDTLTLQYTTYPADGPVHTTARFQRQINTD